MKGALRDALRATWARPEGRVGLSVLSIIVAVALLLPPLLQDPRAQPDILNGSLRPPNASHWLGTDHLSRDVFSRVVHGARVSLAVAAGAVALSVTLGALIGLVAGYAEIAAGQRFHEGAKLGEQRLIETVAGAERS